MVEVETGRFTVGVSDEASLAAFRRLQRKIDFVDVATTALGKVLPKQD